jgi:hypothetical protein
MLLSISDINVQQPSVNIFRFVDFVKVILFQEVAVEITTAT